MGRPPGALSGGTRRRYPQDWELRDPRFEELESDDEDGHGVILDPRARAAFMSDELYLDGYDDGRDRFSRRPMYDPYGDDFDPRELVYGNEEGMAYQTAGREKEEALIQSALARIARARAKGKRNVNLSEEEMEALERRGDQQPGPPNPPPLASPPATPAKPAPKGKTGSRSNSSSNLASKARKRNSGLFGSSTSPAKSNSKAKVSRRSSDERALTYPSAQPASGMMLQGPNGVPIYAPAAYYPPPSPEYARSRADSKPSSRSTSSRRRRESTPPDRLEMYPQYAPRYSHPPAGIRPESSGSNRSLPDDADWYPPGPRHRSTSNVQYTGYHTDYDTNPASPAAQSRRNISGPPDVRYSNLRRTLPTSSLVARPMPQHSSHSDPHMSGRKGSGLSREIGESSSSSSSSDAESDSDEEGVQVEILPDDRRGDGYSINRVSLNAAPPPPVSGNEGRKRRNGRK